MSADFFVADWPAPKGVRTLVTTRHGGVSTGPFASFNLGDHVGDLPAAVASNRLRLDGFLPASPVWLRQVHGVAVVRADVCPGATPEADASVTRQPGVVCGVLTADCLPVLLCDRTGLVVAAAHAGWRGLLAGVLENTVSAMGVLPKEILAWLGPAIGPTAFEVGDEVRQAFLEEDSCSASAFSSGQRQGKWLADLSALAKLRLKRCGVLEIHGGDICTVRESDRFFSYRREGVTGRQGAFIWRDETPTANPPFRV